MSDQRPPSDLDGLGRRLEKARGNARDSAPGAGSKLKAEGSAAGLAFRVGVELVSALAVGAGIGWLLDGWLGTKPWFLAVFILLGFAAGILNVFRVTRGYGYQAGYDRGPEDGNRGSEDEDSGPRS